MKRAPGRPWPLRAQLLGLSLIIAAPLVALVGYNLYREIEHDQREAAAAVLRLAHISAQNTEAFLADARRLLETLAQRPAVLALDRNSCDPLLTDIPKLQSRFPNALTVNRDGDLVCSAVALRPGVPARTDPLLWLNRVRENMQFTIGTPNVGFITQRWVVTLAYPLRDARGNFIGAVGLPVDLVNYPVLPTMAGLPPDTVIAIAGYAGTVIARFPDAQSFVGRSSKDSPVRAAALAAKTGQIESVGLDGVRRVYGFTQIAGSDWYTLAGIPAAEVYAKSYATAKRSALLALAVLLLVVASAYAIARRIEQPLRGIAAAADAVAAGDRAARSPLAGSRETVALGGQFNAMLDALDASERRFRETLDNVHLIAVSLDVRGSVTYCNDYLLEWSGWSREELLGRDWFETFVPDPVPARAAFVQALRDGNLPLHYENEIVKRGGERRIIRWNNTLPRDSADRILGSVRLGEDVTERKRLEGRNREQLEMLTRSEADGKRRQALAESARRAMVNVLEDQRLAANALRKSEMSYRTLFENAADAIVVSSPDGRIFQVNSRACEMFGYSTQEFIGMPASAIAAPIDLAGQRETFRRVATGERVFVNRSYRRKDGSVFPVEINACQTAGGLVLGIVRDVTERKKAEDEVRRLHQELQRHAADLEQRVVVRTAQFEAAKIRAEAADRVKSAFLATMSHELRTPLNSIIGFTGILLQKLPGPLNAEQEKQLGMVRSASRHLLALINDVLDISKVEAGELHLAHERFDLRALLQRRATAFAQEAARRGLAFTLDLGGNESVATGDARRVEQVLNNLLSNALKFTPGGNITINCSREGDSYVIAVADTGVGIKLEDMDKLFRPFSQIDPGLRGVREGTGLGLAISMHLAQAMGGQIAAESEWGKGSRFAFTLPAEARQ